MSKQALIVWGGWDGHSPQRIAEIFRAMLSDDGFAVEVSDSLDTFRDEQKLMKLSLIVPMWTMGKILPEQLDPVVKAVRSGVGMAGVHGGMCDSFRDSTEWQFLTGGQWVAHPGNDSVKYTVKISPTRNPITAGISDFEITSEQYYMHVDPAVRVLATTAFPTADGPHASNGPVDMPVVWTKTYGQGRVFYSSVGHRPADVEMEPHFTLLRRGFAWAARSA